MGRAPCCDKVGMKKGRWTAEEDQILSDYVLSNGEGSWRALPKNAGLKRCGKSCRLRWINYLRSDLKRGNITPEEEDLIVKLHSTLGNRWSIIASNLPGRTDNEIKNYWNSHLSRRLYDFIMKSTVMISPPPTSLPTKKRRPGRTSRSAMKPKFTNSTKSKKNPKVKANKNDVALSVTTVTVQNEEGGKNEALNVLSSSNVGGAEEAGSGPCDYGNNGYSNASINGDDGVFLFNDDIFDTCFLSDVFSSETSNIENSEANRGSSSAGHDNINVVNDDTMAHDFVDWDFVGKEGQPLWDEKEGLGLVSSWLLDVGDTESEIKHDFGEQLDAWLLS